MPTYQYACTACEHRFEAVQAFSDASLSECPECTGRLRKLYGSVGVVFKGSGFYRNDSRPGEKVKADATSMESSTTAKSTETSSGATEKSSGTTEKSAAPKKSESATTSTPSSTSTSTSAKAS
ncbi:FmdB family zinc ribbon protein [Actinokineospora sp.]|uniref:FmdB family zinc ribbon protein n=1 Tax=Actinokineospora sp. TaxID=1872133 RepID=UPI00403761A4